MQTEFYRHIEQEAEMQEIEALLKENGITYEVSSAEALLDSVIVGEGLFPKYTLKLLPGDFEKVKNLIRTHYEQKDFKISDYPQLSQLDNSELIEILQKPEEWSIESEIVARKILQSRDYPIDEEEIKALREEHLSESRKGKRVSPFAQLLYLLAFVAGYYIHIVFMLIGIGMGFYYAYGKATDPRGQKYFLYDKRARWIGKILLYGGMIIFFVQSYFLYLGDIFGVQ
jgi:hypothetical protein